MKKLGIALLFFLIASMGALAQEKFTISGKIQDASNGEVLIGATVYIPNLETGTTTNEYGFFSITLPQGKYNLQVRYLGYVMQKISVDLTSNQMLDLQLEGESNVITEVEVNAEALDANVSNVEMGVAKLSMETIKKVPALMGEIDVIRSIQMTPGVSTVGEGSGGFNVRGGGVDQNLILLDEAPVYNSSHLFGFFSVFHPDAVKDVKLVKGGIPAQYGGRLSSILDIRMKEGNNKKLSGAGGIGTVFSRFALEGPIAKDKASFIVAGRRSYADMFLKLSSDEELKNNQLHFYDLSAKVNWEINENNRIFLSGYFGKDVFRFGEDFQMNWGNTTATLRWNHLFSDRLFANFTGVFSNYNYELGVPSGTQSFEWKSNIMNYIAKADMSYFINPNSTLNFGVDATYYQISPGKVKPLSDNSIFNPFSLEENRGLELAIYIDQELQVNSKLALQYGLRFSRYNYLGGRTVYEYVGEDGKRKERIHAQKFENNEVVTSYQNLEPRFSARYTLNPTSSLKLSYNRMAQYIHLISNTTAATPTDVWTPSTNNIKPQIADQVALGYFRNFKDNAYEFSVEGFYKTMQNQIDYVDGADLLLNEDLEAELLYGTGRAYGLEFFLKKNTGRFNGWITYTLSKSERKINGLSNNEYYPAKYDRTHNLSVVGMFDLSKRWSFGANFTYLTGVANTFPDARYEYDGLVVPHNSQNTRNNFRVPAYHRLDLSATLHGKDKPNKKFHSEWVFSIYNLYARRNAFSIFFRQNETMPTQTEAVRLSIFGSIVPAVTWNFNF